MKKKSMILFIVSIFFTSISLQVVKAQSWLLAGNFDADAGSRLGTNTPVPLNIVTNGLRRIVIDPTGYVGIGTTTPLNLLTLQLNGTVPAASWLAGGSPPVFTGFAEGNSTGFNLLTAGNAATLRPVFNTRRSRGTLAAPGAVINNDYLASFVSSGYDGGAFQNPATIDFYVDGVPSPGNVPARISFVTGSNLGNREERLKIGSTGNISIVAGDLIMGSATKTLQFASPVAGSAPMITMFPSGVNNPNRMVISHSPAFTNYGLQYQDVSDKFNFLSNGLPVLTADLSSRRVGIGTSTPDYLLDVAGRMRVRNDGASAGIWFTNAANTLDRSFFGSANDNYAGLFGNGYGWAIAMNVNNGRVGINNLNPEYVLDVSGRMRVRTGGGTAGTWYMNAANTLDAGFVGMRTDAYIGLYGNSGAGWGLIMNTATGNVGIGTATPNYKLDVCGTIRAKEVRVESGWCDYVFAKDYKLRTLESVASFVEKNQHLPGIPTAKEIQENGLPLAEAQTKMMEKIEEMTLYVIQLNEKIKLLEKKIEVSSKKKK